MIVEVTIQRLESVTEPEVYRAKLIEATTGVEFFGQHWVQVPALLLEKTDASKQIVVQPLRLMNFLITVRRV